MPDPVAGYSKRSLANKLGMKAGIRAAILHMPDGYPLLDGVKQVDPPFAPRSLDFIHLFATSRAELVAEFPPLKAALAPAGTFWISWLKQSAKIPTDLDENFVREFGLAGGLVDVKVAAVDSIWSGLKFVYRLKDR